MPVSTECAAALLSFRYPSYIYIDDNLRQLVFRGKTKSCARKFKYLLLYKLFWNFFFFTFPKKWVGRAMENETFYGDGLIKWLPTLVFPQ